MQIILFIRISDYRITDPSRPGPRGASRSSRTRGGTWWTRAASARRALQGGLSRERSPARTRPAQPAYGKIVWSRRPEAGAKSCGDVARPTGRQRQPSARRRGQECIAPRRERDISRQTTAQGRPGCSGFTCMPLCSLFRTRIAQWTAGASRRPAFPAPSARSGAMTAARLGHDVPRGSKGTSGVGMSVR